LEAIKISFVKIEVFFYFAPEDRGKNEKVTDICDLPIGPLVLLCELPESCDLFLKQVVILQSLIPKIPNKSKFYPGNIFWVDLYHETL